MFELEKGSYICTRNALEVVIDDIYTRTEVSGGLIEHDSKRFLLFKDDLAVGTEVSASYTTVLRYGNPYPRIFVSKTEPEDAEPGDFWLDLDATCGDVPH